MLWQHRTIASASLSRLFAPLPQFRKREIHTVFLHFWNFESEQKSWLRLLAELCGAALYQFLIKDFNYPIPAGNARNGIVRQGADGITQAVNNFFQCGENLVTESALSDLFPYLFNGIHLILFHNKTFQIIAVI